MHAIRVQQYGEPEEMVLQSVPDPTPGTGEVLIEIEIAGVNFTDLWARMGVPGTTDLPFTPGIEIAGSVAAVGADVRGFRPGDRVVGMCWETLGGYAERIVLPVHRVVSIPAGVPTDEAGSMPLNYLTAYAALSWMAQVRRGERVLIHAGAGGVGHAAVQLARLADAEIFATASAGKHGFLRDSGVAHAIDYRSEDFETEIERLTSGEGVDVVLDSLGPSFYQKSYRVLRKGGRLVCFGASEAVKNAKSVAAEDLAEWQRPDFSSIAMSLDSRAVMGCSLDLDSSLLSRWMEHLFELHREGRIRPHIGARFGLGDAARAHWMIHNRENIGKVLLST